VGKCRYAGIGMGIWVLQQHSFWSGGHAQEYMPQNLFAVWQATTSSYMMAILILRFYSIPAPQFFKSQNRIKKFCVLTQFGVRVWKEFLIET
jgi:hypothetical protein